MISYFDLINDDIILKIFETRTDEIENVLDILEKKMNKIDFKIINFLKTGDDINLKKYTDYLFDIAITGQVVFVLEYSLYFDENDENYYRKTYISETFFSPSYYDMISSINTAFKPLQDSHLMFDDIELMDDIVYIDRHLKLKEINNNNYTKYYEIILRT